MNPRFDFYNLAEKKKSTNINLLFDNWEPGENVVVFSPHDDDCILGAGYLMSACLEKGANVYVIIFHDGCAGYSQPDLKDEIIEIRKKETISALDVLGVKETNIIRFNIPDFSGFIYLGWKLPWISDDNRENEGLFPKLVSKLREIKATRLIFPNGYREHIDHTTASLCGIFHGSQIGDAIITDYGEPQKIKTFLQYSVWSKLSPEDALVNRRDIKIRANRAVVVKEAMENKIQKSLMEFKSQQEIISYILGVRKERRIENSNRFIELYLDVDPRPRFDYNPYKNLIREIDKD